MKLKRGSTSVRRLIFIADSTSTVGAGLANLVYNTSSLVAYYFAGDLSNEVQITLATATLGTWASGGFVAVDNTNMPGWYEIGIPNAALDGGNECAIQLRGAANMVPVNIYIELDTVDYQTAAFGANTTTPPTAAANADAVWDEARSGHVTAGTFGEKVNAELDSNARVKLDATQPDYAPATAANLALAKTILDKIDTGLVQDGLVHQFTANMLELAPSSGGDASQATLLAVKAKTDLIGTAAGATQLLAASVLEPGTITSFPETLRVGDSYTDAIGRGIQLPIVDTDGVALTSAGNKNFADAIATFVIKRANDTESSRIITGTAVFVDPPGTGTGDAPYALIEIPSSETAKGLVKYRYTGLLTFTWPYVGTGTDAEVMTFETGTITFET